MVKPLYYGKQTIEAADLEAVRDVLNSDFLTQGPMVSCFEHALEQQLQVPHVISCSNGTAALHLACMALEIEARDEVWVSAVSFVATANGARYCGANIRFIDIDWHTGNISLSALSTQLEQAAQRAQLPKALIVVHLGGESCDMRRIHELCQPYNIRIIEDSCHALGGSYQDEPIGNCRYSDCCVFSFHPVKSITTAEGGAVSCRNADVAERLRMLASHGISKDAAQWQSADASDAPWYYEQQELGYNYRLSDLQAALGAAQLPRLSRWIELRAQIAKRYQEAFAGLLSMQHHRSDSQSAYHLAIVLCDSNAERDELYQSLRKAQIFAQLHYIPIYRHPYYQQQNQVNYADFPGSERYYERALSLPIYPRLSPTDQQRVIDVVIDAVQTYRCQSPKSSQL